MPNVVRELAGGWVYEGAMDLLHHGCALSFTRAVAKTIDLSCATFTTCVSDAVHENDLRKLNEGGKVASEGVGRQYDHGPPGYRLEAICDTRQWLAKYLASECIGKLSFVLVEDWMAEPKYLSQEGYSRPAVLFGKEVYYVFDPREAVMDEQMYRLYSPCLNYSAAYLVHDMRPPAPGCQMTSGFVEEMASHVGKVIFSVYDNESFLVCDCG